MKPEPFPGSLYVLTIDSEDSVEKAQTARLIHVHSDGKKHVALFTLEERAKQWVQENTPRNTVLRPLALESKAEVVGFLKDLIENGDTRVCIDPIKHVGGFGEIADLIERVEGFA